MMPKNAAGSPIEPADYNWSDGFSPGAPIVTKVPGLDTQAAFARTGSVPITDVARSFDRDAPIVVINARTLRRQLIWTELDANASTPADTALLIHPAKNLREGERYIVALRDLRGADGALLEPSPAFRAYRDRVKTGIGAFERRRPHMERIFKRLKRAGVKRRDLYLAWDFTVASAKSLSGRMRGIRDARLPRARRQEPRRPARERLGAQVQDHQDHRASRPPRTRSSSGAWRGRSRCPATSTSPAARPGRGSGSGRTASRCAPPATSPTPTSSATSRARSARRRRGGCRSTATGCSAAPPRSTASASSRSRASTGWCCARATGSACPAATCPTRSRSSGTCRRFPELADRLQQGFLNFLFLGRAMIHPKGFSSSLAFWDSKGPLIDTRKLYYSGGSQGGIAGGALTAVAPDFTRSVLIVPAMNYSLLLTRSVDFDPFASVLYPAYPDELIRPLLLSLIQTLWDRGEPGRLRLAHDDRPVPEHAGAHRAAPHGVRRPPGRQRRHRGRGADDRREDPAAGGRPGPSHRRASLLRDRADHAGTRTAAARWSSGTSARCAATSAPRRRRSRTRRRGWAATRTGSPAARPAPSSSSRASSTASSSTSAEHALPRRRVDRAMRRCAALAAAIALCAAGSASAHPVVPAPQAPPGCDPLGTGNCLFPWPNDYFTEPRAPGADRVDDAAQQRRGPDRAERLQPRRRVQPGPDDRAQGARARHPGGASRRPARCRSRTWRAPTTAASRSS